MFIGLYSFIETYKHMNRDLQTERAQVCRSTGFWSESLQMCVGLFWCVLVSFEVCWSLWKEHRYVVVQVFGLSLIYIRIWGSLMWSETHFVYSCCVCRSTGFWSESLQIFVGLFWCLLVSFDVCWSLLKHVGLFWCIYGESWYGVALASRIDKIIGLFCKRAL